MSDAIKGFLIGLVFGGLGGLGICIWVIPGNWIFPGDTILIGGTIGAVLGVLYGEDFFDFVRDYWHRF